MKKFKVHYFVKKNASGKNKECAARDSNSARPRGKRTFYP